MNLSCMLYLADLLPSKATQSMPNLQKQNTSLTEVSNRRSLPFSGNHSDIPSTTKRHSLTNMEHRSQSFTAPRRSSITGIFKLPYSLEIIAFKFQYFLLD